ncbi:MAG: hypothetical protein ABI999_06265 [Acidobacteriota bacterium]
MLIKRFLILAALMVFVGLVTANAQSERVSVRVTQEKPSVLGKFSVKFLSVVDDSRCPISATCVWAGNAKIKIQLSKGRNGKEFELNTGIQPSTIEYKGYKIKIVRLSPKPGEMTKAMGAKHTAVFEIAKLKN